MRYQRRRNLADFYRYPEGYEFQLELASGHQQAVILLTPPDLIAVRQQDGTWTREATASHIATSSPSKRCFVLLDASQLRWQIP